MRSSAHPISGLTWAAGAVFGMSLVGPAAQAAEYAKVVAATPVNVNLPVSRQACSDAPQYVRQRPSGAGALLGAIAGGVIGYNLGGYDRGATTGIGAVVGSVIGDNVEANAGPIAEVPVRRCQAVSAYADRTVGYDVMYDYAGQLYSVRMARDPGSQLAVSVQPADPSGASLPAPVYNDPVPQPFVDAAPPPIVYHEPVPSTVYYPSAASIYVAPVIGFGFGYYGRYPGGYHGGYHGGRRGGHYGGGHHGGSHGGHPHRGR